MTNTKLGIMVLSIFIVLVVLVFKGFTLAHEDAHRKILQYHGCQDVNITTERFFGGSASCNDYNYKMSDDEIYLHSMNEIIGYNIEWLIVAIFTVGYGLIFVRLYNE